MKFGFVLPSGDARVAADLAYEAEQAGWDGFFVWEPVWGVDAWVSLTAAAMRTERIRLGTMLTPLSRMRPWKLASETATLDNLSGGRVILSVGLGATDTGFGTFGEETDRKKRAELMDEGLDILTGLWRGQPFLRRQALPHHADGVHACRHHPCSSRASRSGWSRAWPFKKSMQRALRYDGIIPSRVATTATCARRRRTKCARSQRTSPDTQATARRSTSSSRARRRRPIRARASAKVVPWREAARRGTSRRDGVATEGPDAIEQLRRRLAAGPPRVD